MRDAPGFPEAWLPLLDQRANPKGTWQWLVLVSRATGQAWGLHVWIEGYLSPVYRDLLGRLAETGLTVQSARQEKDKLMRVLTAVRPGALPEFDEGARADRRPSSY